MQLRKIKVNNFRSLEDVIVDEFGNFNVLIGKNNSGKSSLLHALFLFFRSVDPQSVIKLEPALGLPSDYTFKALSRDLSITAEFALGEAERDRLLKRIAEEMPQIARVVESIPKQLTLEIEIKVQGKATKRFCFVRSMRLNDVTDPRQSWVLVEIGDEAAKLMFERASQSRSADSKLAIVEELLQTFTADEWESGRSSREVLISRPWRRKGEDPDPDLWKQLNAALRRSQTFDEFNAALREMVVNLSGRKGAITLTATEISIKTLSGEETDVPQFVVQTIAEISQTKILYVTERRKAIGAEEAQKLLRLKTRRGGDQTLSRIQTTVKDLLGVKIDAYSPESDSEPVRLVRPGRIDAELDVDDFLVELNGSGIKEALRLVLDTTFEQPTILLVEEPEIHLHPALETSMTRFLKDTSATAQVFITTHSTNFLDTGDYQSVYLVKKSRTTTVQRLSLTEIEQQIPVELGIRLSAVFMYDKLVFVEGQSDEMIIREFCRALSINLAQTGVGFIHLSGVGNLAHYAASHTLAFLTKRRVKLWFFIDRDERLDSEIEKIRGKLGNEAAFEPTKAREIENYLLQASALSQYLQSLGVPPADCSEKKIHDLMEEQVAALKELTLYKQLFHRLKPVHPKRVEYQPATDGTSTETQISNIVEEMLLAVTQTKSGLDSMLATVRQQFDQDWNARKFQLVLGSKVIDGVMKHFGRRYEKLRDGPKIAASIEKSAIDPELRHALLSLEGA